MRADISIEYAHIYTKDRIGEEHLLSVSLLKEIKQEFLDKKVSFVVLVDDYSFPDPSFDYESFSRWLGEQGFLPDRLVRESQLIPFCDGVLALIETPALKEEILAYTRSKRYPCSLFVATWYLMRLGALPDALLPDHCVAHALLNILPQSFKPFEEKAFEIIRSTKFREMAGRIENRYFAGRTVV